MLEPNLENDGPWHHIASDAELKRAMNSKGNEIIEVSMIGKTFVICHPRNTIVRCNVLGGDYQDIEGGWIYDHPFKLERDRQEILKIPSAVSL